MVLFGLVLVIAASSAITTGRQVEKAGQQEKMAWNIALAASELSYLSNDYLIYRESQQLKRWQSRVASFSAQVAGLRVDSPEQQALVLNIQANQQRLEEVFNSVASAVGNPSQIQRTALDSGFLQVSWSRMAVQTQSLVSDASRLSRLIHDQAARSKQINMIVILTMITIFGAYFLIHYLVVHRRLNSIATLQAGTAVIGAGDLDFTIEERRNDEIGDLARAFNRMTANLKAVTASKADLEREIAERKRAEEALRESENHLRIVADFPYDCEYWRGRDERFLYMSPSCERITGYTRQEFIEDPALYFRIIHPDDRERVAKHLRDDKIDLRNCSLEFRITCRDGMERWISHVCQPVLGVNGEFLGRRASDRDVTERRRTEEVLRETHKKLQEHAARLEAANKELESFGYSVSHDLRSPLRAIGGFSRMILDEQGGSFDTETLRKFNIVQENVGKMGRLIDDLLRLSRLGRAGMSRLKLDMASMVREVLNEIRLSEPERNFAVEIGELPKADGDPVMIRQLMVNLLSNAVKFTRRRQGARIIVGSYETPAENVYFVKDNGIGFDMKYRDKLFGVFQRLVRESDFEGTGVGLAIVQRIVLRHGGRIWAEGKIQEGAAFYFTLPRMEQARSDKGLSG
jgi:PAS domain S-box-containing protein